MKKIVILLVFAATFNIAGAQGFTKAVGIRGGYTSGFEYRMYTDDMNSFKFLLGTRAVEGGVQLHVLKEYHKYDLFDFAYQIVFYYGFGVHGGFETWDEPHYNNNVRWVDTRASAIVGLDGLAGLEYVFDAAPVSAGLEVKPFFDLLGQKTFDLQPFDFAFTVKYLF